MSYDSYVFSVDLPKMLFELSVDGLPMFLRLIHDLDLPLLVGQQLRMYVDVFLLFGLDLFLQYLVLPGIVDSGALVGCPQIEHCLSHQQLLGEGIVYPFLNDKKGTYISC